MWRLVTAMFVLPPQCLLILDMQAILIEPNGHAMAGKPTLGINIEPLHTDIAMSVDCSRKLQVAKNAL